MALVRSIYLDIDGGVLAALRGKGRILWKAGLTFVTAMCRELEELEKLIQSLLRQY